MTLSSHLVTATDESNSAYPGFAYRCNAGCSSMDMTARWPGKSNANNADSTNVPKQVTILRQNNIIYYKIGASDLKKLIEVPSEDLTSDFKPNLTFGASLDKSLKPFRYFTGIVSNIHVQLYDENS